MKAKETAVVLIEFQNEFCKGGGKLHDGVKGEIDRQGTISNAVMLAEGARQKGAVVIHAPFIFNPEYCDQHQMAGIVKAVADSNAFREGTWGAAIIDELKPQISDMVFNKNTGSAFTSTNIDLILRNIGIESLVITGVATDSCVETTARDASDRGYNCILVEDACCARAQDRHDMTMKTFASIFGKVMNTSEVISILKLPKMK